MRAKGASITYAQAAAALGQPPAQTLPTTVPVKQAPKAYIAGAPGGDLDLAINDATKKANTVVENTKALAAVLAMATRKILSGQRGDRCMCVGELNA